MSKAICKTCGATGPPWNHKPSPLDRDGIANIGHKMNPNDTDLREKIIALRKQRDSHQIDESDYIDGVMALVEEHTQAAVREARIDELRSLEKYAEIIDKEHIDMVGMHKILDRIAELSKEQGDV